MGSGVEALQPESAKRSETWITELCGSVVLFESEGSIDFTRIIRAPDPIVPLK